MTEDEGKRYRRTYQGDNVYVVVSDNRGDGCPYSITISISNERINRDHDKQSMIHAIERFVNVALRTVGVDVTMRKLRACSMGNSTMIGIIYDVMLQYLEEL